MYCTVLVVHKYLVYRAKISYTVPNNSGLLEIYSVDGNVSYIPVHGKSSRLAAAKISRNCS